MTSFLNSLGYFTLKFQRVTRNTAGQHLTLIIEELLEEFRVFIIYVLDAHFLETAVFLLTFLLLNGG